MFFAKFKLKGGKEETLNLIDRSINQMGCKSPGNKDGNFRRNTEFVRGALRSVKNNELEIFNN